jgi:phosphonate transport system substrate-binding protein
VRCETLVETPAHKSCGEVDVRVRTNRKRRTGVLAVLLALVATACGAQSSSARYIDLSQREPVADALPADGPEPLRVAVAAVLSPERTLDNYAGLGLYLGERLNRPVELVQRRTYAEVNDLVAAGAVDVAFVCTSAYVVGSAAGEMDLLVVPEVGGGTVYHSTVIVAADGVAETVEDLRGASFAFTDPMSLTGRVYPTHLVEQLGSSTDEFFGSTLFTYSHDRAIEAVADGVADGAAVDSLVLEYALEREPELAERLRVIHRSAPFGIPPVVVPAGAAVELRADLERALLDLGRDAVGASILSQIGVDRFVLGADAAYDDARALVGSTELRP